MGVVWPVVGAKGVVGMVRNVVVVRRGSVLLPASSRKWSVLTVVEDAQGCAGPLVDL